MVELDVLKLNQKAKELRLIIKRNESLLTQLNQSPIPIMSKFAFRTLLQQNDRALSACAAYLEETAADYETVEKDLIKALETGKYVLTTEFPQMIPQPAPDKGKLEGFATDNREALKELEDMIRNGEYNTRAFIEWLINSGLIDSENLSKIFGDTPENEERWKTIEDFLKFASDAYDTFNDIMDAVDAYDNGIIPKDVMDGLGGVGVGISGIGALFAQDDLAVGLAALVWGIANDDQQMACAGADYLDSALSDIADCIVTVATLEVPFPYGFLIGVGVDYKINQLTNRIESFVEKDSVLERWWGQNVAAPAETILDYTIGNFIGQLVITEKVEKPAKQIVDFIAACYENAAGFDILKEPHLNALYNTENWGKAFYNEAMNFLDEPIDYIEDRVQHITEHITKGV